MNPKIALAADLILTMTRDHRDEVLELAPRKLNRTFTLVEAALLADQFSTATLTDLPALRSRLRTSEVHDVQDPIGESPEIFENVGNQIAGLLPPVLDLCRRSGI